MHSKNQQLDKQKTIDLIVLDLDGTILDEQGVISPAVRTAIAAAQAAGVPVTIGTGRAFGFIRRILLDLGISIPVLTTQGAVIADPVSGQVLSESLMPLSLSRAVANWADREPHISVFYFTSPDGSARIYQNRLDDHAGQSAQTAEQTDYLNYLLGSPRIFVPSLSSLLEGRRQRTPVKYMVINDPDQEGDLAPLLRARFEPDIYVTRTHPILVEACAAGVDKGTGLQRLCRTLSVDLERVLVVGDNDNDIPMLEIAGIGVAMGNASAALKAVADWIAPTLEQEGAAAAIERYLFPIA